jgi:hypothetical protein
MALLDTNSRDFQTSVTRSGFHYKTSRLKRLITALEDVQKHPTDRVKLAYLHKRLWRWRHKEPKEYAARNARFDELLREIQGKARTLGVALTVPGAAAAPPENAAWTFVQRVEGPLNDFKDFACGDAFMYSYDKNTKSIDYTKGFAACINPSKRDVVKARSDGLKGTTRGAASPFDSHVAAGEWKAKNYEQVCGRVLSERAGICVTFAKSAAHLLTHGQTDGPRVEIVSFKNHVYVLVGRQGGVTDNGYVDADWTAEPDVIIVDPWAASMGFECVYRGFGRYPYKGMANPLLLVASWSPSADE